jgi:hypothetical protein
MNFKIKLTFPMIHFTNPPNKLRQALPEPCLENKTYKNSSILEPFQEKMLVKYQMLIATSLLESLFSKKP